MKYDCLAVFGDAKPETVGLQDGIIYRVNLSIGFETRTITASLMCTPDL